MTASVNRYWYPLVALVRRDIKKRYATTTFGLAWTVVQPAILLTIYVVVFGFIFRYGRSDADARQFVFYLIAGMLPYLAISEALHRAVIALREDRALLEREAFPAVVVPASRVITSSVSETIGLILVLLLGPFFGLSLSGWVVMLPLLVALRVVITCGLAWMASILAVFVADLAEVLSLLLTVWLFLTPIFYTADSVPAPLRRVLVLNPLYQIAQAYRAVLIEGRAPLSEGLVALVWAVALAGAGWWFFNKAIDRGRDLL